MIAGMEIRELRYEDVEQVVRIHGMLIRKPTPEVVAELVRENLEKKNGVGFVAVLDGKILGFMMGEFKRGAFGLEESFWVEMMGVHHKHMGEGVGRAIGDRLFEFCKSKGVIDIYTAVRWDSVDILSFFKILGFDRSNFINLRKRLT
jgi:GNAT superfamily N-acetyltransferase